MLRIDIFATVITFCFPFSISSQVSSPQTEGFLQCKRQCMFYRGCTSVSYDSRFLLCELIFGNYNSLDAGEKGIRIAKVQHQNTSVVCGEKERIVKSRSGSLKCLKGIRTLSTKKKRKLCTIKSSNAPCNMTAEVKKPFTGTDNVTEDKKKHSNTTDVTTEDKKMSSHAKDEHTKPSKPSDNAIAEDRKKPSHGPNNVTAVDEQKKPSNVHELTAEDEKKPSNVHDVTAEDEKKPSNVHDNMMAENEQKRLTNVHDNVTTEDEQKKNSHVSDNVTADNVTTEDGQKKPLNVHDNGTTGDEQKKRSHVSDNMTAEDEQSQCVLHRQVNVTSPDMRILMKMPLTLLPGMKMSVYGHNIHGLSYSQLSITMDPEHPTNVFSWLHIRPHWKTKKLAFTEGLSNSKYEGDFPISDPSHFTLALELTQSSTKIYADNLLVKTRHLVSGIKEFYLHRYTVVYQLVVQKTGEGCDEVDVGLP